MQVLNGGNSILIGIEDEKTAQDLAHFVHKCTFQLQAKSELRKLVRWKRRELIAIDAWKFIDRSQWIFMSKYLWQLTRVIPPIPNLTMCGCKYSCVFLNAPLWDYSYYQDRE